MRPYNCTWCGEQCFDNQLHKCDTEALHKRIMQAETHTELYREKVEVLMKEFGNEIAKAYNRGFELGRDYEKERG